MKIEKRTREDVQWQEFVRDHADELRYEMLLALFDDVRDAWQDYTPPAVLRRELTPGETLRAEMQRALFDDVRPAWEAYFAGKGDARQGRELRHAA